MHVGDGFATSDPWGCFFCGMPYPGSARSRGVARQGGLLTISAPGESRRSANIYMDRPAATFRELTMERQWMHDTGSNRVWDSKLK